MQFYHVGHDAFSQDMWPWAVTLHPRLSEISASCDVCNIGRLYPEKYPERSFTVDVEGGSAYPDVLACGAYPLLIVSEAVIEDWESQQVTGYEKFPVNIGRVEEVKNKLANPPQYYHIKVNGRCLLNLNAMGVEVAFHCPKCGYTEIRNRPLMGCKFVIVSATWDGSDLFVNPYFPAVVFCSRRVFELAGQNRRTNFRFELPEKMDEFPGQTIDYITEAQSRNPGSGR